MSNDRADRLEERRRNRQDRSGADDDGVENNGVGTESEQTTSTSQTTQAPVTDRAHSTFYLRDDLRDELRQTRKRVELDVDLEYSVELEKNRHIRPLLLYLGAQELAEYTPDEIVTLLNETECLDSIIDD